MITEKSIKESLADVLLPGLQRDISSMGLVQAVELAGNKVKVTLASSALTRMRRAGSKRNPRT